MTSYHNPLHASCIADHKDLNEAVLAAVSHVAQCNLHHCTELFGISLRLAERLAHMAHESHGALDPLLDLATTPSALWRVVMTADHVHLMQRGVAPMSKSYLEPYRAVVASLNEMVILTLLRYAAEPRMVAMMSGLGDQDCMAVLSSTSCSTLLQSAKNIGRPLIELTLNEAYLDRVFATPDGVPVGASLRALLARTLCTWQDFGALTQSIEDEQKLAAPKPAPKIGRPTAVFLPPGEADVIERLIAHGVSSRMILEFTRSEVNLAQVRRLRLTADAEMPSGGGPKVRRFQDSNAAVWGSAVRRLTVTAIFSHQRLLMSMGMSAHAAFVQAYEYHDFHYQDATNSLSLPRLISAVFLPLRSGLVHLGHCDDCGTMHLLHDSYHNGIECPVCALAKFNKLGRSTVTRSSSPVRIPRQATVLHPLKTASAEQGEASSGAASAPGAVCAREEAGKLKRPIIRREAQDRLNWARPGARGYRRQP